MSQIIKPVMLDETGQVTNQRLTDLGTKIDAHKTETASQISGIGTKLNSVATNTAAVANNLNAIAEGIASVHSVNGRTGDVVIDSTNIPLSQTNVKTISQVLSEEQSSVSSAVSEIQAAVARTPVSFSANVIENDDYLLAIALGTP